MSALKSFRLMFAGCVLLALAVVPALAQEEGSERVIDLVASTEEFEAWLATYEGWIGYAWSSEEDGTWYVEFYDQAEEEWLGYASVLIETDEIVDSFIPIPLPPEEYDAGKERIEVLVLDDPEVQARLLDPLLWSMWTDFNRYDRVWEVWFSRGLESIVVTATLDEDSFSISDIADGNALDEETALQNARDEAISLAYSAPGIDVALEDHDDWITYAERQEDDVWSVSFVAGGDELFYALVNTAEDTVLDAS